jgi:tetratricopeptide (TPR) repeat protein
VTRHVLVILGVLVALAGAQKERSSPAFLAYERANSLFAEGRFAESSRLVEEALQLDPKLAPAWTLKAKLAMAAKDHKAAREALLSAVAAAPTSWYARFLLGFQYYLQNEMQLAVTELERAAQLNPAESKPVLYLGLTHESLGNNAKAVDCYRQSIRMDQAARKLEPETLLILARLLLILDRREECANLIDSALKLKPDFRDTHYERSRLLLKLGDFAGAARAAEQALTLPAAGGASDKQIHYLLVRAYGLMGDEKRAAGHAALLRGEEAAPRK